MLLDVLKSCVETVDENKPVLRGTEKNPVNFNHVKVTSE